MPFTTLCTLNEIPALGARRYVRDDGLTIAVFRGEGDKLFALNDKCPHKGGPLSQGIVFGETVACPLHNWCISLNDGCATAPDVGATERYAVKLVDGNVALDPYSGQLTALAVDETAAT